MKCFKITYRNCSLISRGKARVHYKIGEFVKAPEWLAEKGFHLFAFRTLDDAIRFKSENLYIYDNYISFWIAEGKGRVRLPKYYYDSSLVNSGKRGDDWEYIPAYYPKGTIMFKEIKLVEKIIWD